MQKEPVLYKILSPIFKFLMIVLFNIKVVNKEYIPKEGSAVIAGNHKFYFDPVAIDFCTKRVVYALAFAGYYYKAEFFFKNVGSIPVVKENGKGKEALNEAIRRLKLGCAINISPEGKMNKTDEILLPFKKGAVIMAKESNSKIIPYAITGSYNIFKRNLKVTFGEPIDVSDMGIEDANALLYEKVKQLLIENK